ncbi:hypothetical protein [Rhodococcus jostii]|uniref:hypothetical protein n=1 Tax=Rhodococcus jostii TaxID=132919 RepID=UPI0013C3187F|nr:hypothetical protein [Rhodococcus jostii]
MGVNTAFGNGLLGTPLGETKNGRCTTVGEGRIDSGPPARHIALRQRQRQRQCTRRRGA